MCLMFKPFRYYQAVLTARLAMLAIKILGRRGSHYPGVLILKICPDFLKYVVHPKKLIAITGTNGKTTVTNLVSDSLKDLGYQVADNAYGSNIQEGIFVAMLKGSNFWLTKSSVDIVILEVDERVSPKIYPYLKPDVLLITNLFRDSYRRNAHVDFIAHILETTIPESTHLIVNADDPISSFLTYNERTTYAIAPQLHEVQVTNSRINDFVICPRCAHPIKYRFNRYHHIGQVYCSHCRFESLKGDLLIEHVDQDQQTVTMFVDRERYVFKALGSSMIDHYNLLASVTLLRHLGIDLNDIQAVFDKLKIVQTRFDETHESGKTITIMMTKDQNPVATSRIFDIIAHHPSEKIGVILINENSESGTTSENMAWYYDADFEYLNSEKITQIIGGGYRILDLKVRLLMADIAERKLAFSPKEYDCADLVDFYRVDHVFILNGTKNIEEAHNIKRRLIERIKAEVRS